MAVGATEFYASLLEVFTILQWTKLVTVSATTLVLYDHMITLDQEVNLVWRARWSVGKILFIIIRYENLFIFPFQTLAMFIPAPTEQFCVAWVRWEWCIGLTTSLLAEIVLQLRIYAMYGRSKKIALLLITGFSLSVVATLIILIKLFLSDQVMNALIPGVRPLFCTLNVPPFWWSFWIPTITFELLLFGLALYKGYESLCSQASIGWSGKTTLDILIQDSIFYFLVVFSVYVINLILWTTGGIKFAPIVLVYTVAMPSIMSQRLLLNIRRSLKTTIGDTAPAGVDTWVVPQWTSSADVQQEGEVAENDQGEVFAENEVAIQRVSCGSLAEVDVVLEDSSRLSETQT